MISDSSFDDNGLNTNMSPPKKKSKLKRLVKFNNAWLN